MSSFSDAERDDLTGGGGARRLGRVAWHPRGVEVRGRAEAIEAPEAVIRIHADRVVSWGLEPYY